jgi:beta-lactamase superfamily II metal-dependent hydrolase
MRPAAQGDCIWIEYGDPQSPHRVLIDTGPPNTRAALRDAIEALPPDQRCFELFIVSHLDNDHIGGAIALLDDPPDGLTFGDVWFNGYRHLISEPEPDDKLGVREAQMLTKNLGDGKLPWNRAFDGGAVVVPDDGPLPVRHLPGGLTLTLLSPYRVQLDALEPVWLEALRKLKAKEPDLIDDESADRLGGKIDVRALAESHFSADPSEENGSSIAIMVEYGGARAILAADALSSVIERSVDRMLAETGDSRLVVEAFKVCHHGSRRNTAPDLPRKLSARNYLFSTNGTQTRHPNLETVARLIYHGEPGATLWFNYRTEWNRDWDDGVLKKRHRYRTEYPDTPGTLTLNLEQTR